MSIYQAENIVKDTYKEVRDEFEKAGMLSEYFAGANETNEKNFWKQAQSNKVTREIVSVYRLKVGHEEKIFYHEHLVSKNRLGNKIDHSRVFGKQDHKEFIIQYDDQGNEAPFVDNTVTKYSIPFGHKFLRDEVEPFLIDNPNFYVVEFGKKYGGFNFNDFATLTFDELVKLGRYGTLSPEVIQKIPRRGAGRKMEEKQNA